MSVFGLTNADITFGSGATTINGDVGLGPHTTGSLIKATINGKLFKDPTSTASISAKDLTVTGGVVIKDLTGAVNDALAASAFWAGLAPTQTFGDITTSTTITGSGGLNVIAVNSINMVGGTLTLAGTPTSIFIFNVAGDFILNGTQMVLSVSGGVDFGRVLWNFPTAGTDIKIFKPVGSAFGTFLAPIRGVLLDKAQLTGAIISSGSILVHSGALICP